MSQIVDTKGSPLTEDPLVDPDLQPMKYVFHVNSNRGPNGEIHARDIFMVVDPSWVGLPRYYGTTHVVFAVPGYDRPEKKEALDRSTPYIEPVFDPSRSVPLDSLTPQEQHHIISGGVIADSSRFTYALSVVHPKVLALQSEFLMPLTPDIHVIFNPEIASRDLANLPEILDELYDEGRDAVDDDTDPDDDTSEPVANPSETASWPENSEPSAPNEPLVLVPGGFRQGSPNDTDHSHSETVD